MRALTPNGSAKGAVVAMPKRTRFANTRSGFDYLIVGAGFAGSVLAERLATELDKRFGGLIDHGMHAQQPRIEPGEAFAYSSFCPLGTWIADVCFPQAHDCAHSFDINGRISMFETYITHHILPISCFEQAMGETKLTGR